MLHDGGPTLDRLVTEGADGHLHLFLAVSTHKMAIWAGKDPYWRSHGVNADWTSWGWRTVADEGEVKALSFSSRSVIFLLYS